MEYRTEEIFEKIQYDGFVTNCEFENCTFIGCNFTAVTFRNCAFSNCQFEKCAFRTIKFQFSTMQGSIFSECLLMGINWGELQSKGNRLFPIEKLERCTLKFNNFIHVNMIRFDFSNMTIQDSYFHDCRLSHASFRNDDMNRTNFSGCNLNCSDFRGARGYNIDLQSNTLKQARFSFPDVVDLLNTLDIVIE